MTRALIWTTKFFSDIVQIIIAKLQFQGSFLFLWNLLKYYTKSHPGNQSQVPKKRWKQIILFYCLVYGLQMFSYSSSSQIFAGIIWERIRRRRKTQIALRILINLDLSSHSTRINNSLRLVIKYLNKYFDNRNHWGLGIVNEISNSMPDWGSLRHLLRQYEFLFKFMFETYKKILLLLFLYHYTSRYITTIYLDSFPYTYKYIYQQTGSLVYFMPFLLCLYITWME